MPRADACASVGLRRAGLRRAGRLCALTVAWNVSVGSGAVLTALATGSLSLIGFGINAVVDSLASAVLIWRFRAERRGHAERAHRAELLALRLAAGAFLLISLYVLVQGVRTLAKGQEFKATAFGIAEAAASLFVLPVLASVKFSLSEHLESRALRADSLLTWSGVGLAALAFVALVAQSMFGWWWADPLGAFAIAALLAWQGVCTLR